MKMRATRQRRKPFSRTTDFARRLLAEWKKLKLPNANENVVVAVSGGADSCTMLLALDELLKARKLSLKLVVAHLDHGLRKASKEDAGSKIQLARPLLSWARRGDTEDYCRVRKVHFRVDEMNEDEAFARVKIRKQLLPLMQSFNNKIVEALARTAALLREDAAALSDEASKLLELAGKGSPNENAEAKVPLLRVDILARAPAAIRRRALRRWLLLARGDLRRLEMVHLL